MDARYSQLARPLFFPPAAASTPRQQQYGAPTLYTAYGAIQQGNTSSLGGRSLGGFGAEGFRAAAAGGAGYAAAAFNNNIAAMESQQSGGGVGLGW